MQSLHIHTLESYLIKDIIKKLKRIINKKTNQKKIKKEYRFYTIKEKH